MAASKLSIQEIHEYFVKKGGIVANHEVVKHFKPYLTDSASKADARVKFKKYINVLATTKTENEEKFLILRPKYAACLETQSMSSPPPYCDARNSLGIPISPIHSSQEFAHLSPSRQPPPYRPPPPPPPSTPSPNISFDSISVSSFNVSSQDSNPPQMPNVSTCSLNTSVSNQSPPRVPPRRKSAELLKLERGNSESKDVNENDNSELLNQENDKQPISVKERTQKFNRLASVEDELSPKPQKEKNKETKGADEDDGVSVTSLDQKKCTEWLVTAAKGDYQELAKLAADEPRLAKLKDPFTTVLHWGAKHGNEDIVKLFAGKYRVDVNSKTGYTPLHMAVQFGHKNVYNLLIEVYRANPDLRDFSGRKPSQYETLQTQAANKDTYKIKSRKKLADKDLRFLRIGSLNVRVKKTTEAFSNFLGVGGSSTIIPLDNMSDKMQKSWGSADNVSQEALMPAPKGYLGKRKTKKYSESSGTLSTPGTPHQGRNLTNRNSIQDSDSDSAAGFDSHWKN